MISGGVFYLSPLRSYDRSFLSILKMDTRPDVHFDGPKMDETSEATHAVKGLGCLKRT
jgi:hypothetical protein